MDPIPTSYTATIASRVFEVVIDGTRQQIRLKLASLFRTLRLSMVQTGDALFAY